MLVRLDKELCEWRNALQMSSTWVLKLEERMLRFTLVRKNICVFSFCATKGMHKISVLRNRTCVN